MPPFIQQLLTKATELWTSRPLAQRVLFAGLAASILIALLAMIFWLGKVNYKVLYSQLYQEDAASVVEFLKKEKVDYKISDSGNTILVPEKQVYELRLKLASQGTLHGQGIGFEVFDQTNIGQTSFVQNINYQRALQGELGRTISELPEVESARVHLVMPSKSLFVEEQAPPSAAIMLKLKGSKSLTSQQVQAIVNLVSTSVEGMEVEHITVSDSRGKVLYEPKAANGLAGMTSTQMEYQLTMQRNLEQRIEQLLVPILGEGRVIARVNADLDFSQTTIRKEIYDPKSSVVRSEVKSEEDSRGTANVGLDGPDPKYQAENDYGSSGTTQETSRTSSTTNYEINKEEQQIVAPMGSVKRLSVAVLADGKFVRQADGSYVFEPLPEEQIAQIRQLVQRTVGFDDNRGDAIEVSSIAFGEAPSGSQPLVEVASRYFQIMGKPLLNTLIILLFLILVARPLILNLIKPKVSETEMQTPEELEAREELMALSETMSDDDVALQDAAKRIENAKLLALQLVEQNMEHAVIIIRQWLAQGEA